MDIRPQIDGFRFKGTRSCQLVEDYLSNVEMFDKELNEALETNEVGEILITMVDKETHRVITSFWKEVSKLDFNNF